MIWQNATPNVRRGSWSTMTAASRTTPCTMDSGRLKQNLEKKITKEGEMGRGERSSKCQAPFYDIQDNNILHVSRLPITTSTQHLKWDYIKIKPKMKFFSFFLILSPTVLLYLLGSLWYHDLRQDKNCSTLQGDSSLNQHIKLSVSAARMLHLAAPLKSFLY